MKHNAFGNLSGFGMTAEEHAAALGVDADKLASALRALEKTRARGVSACAKSLALAGQAQMFYGMMMAHAYSGRIPVATAYKVRVGEAVNSTIAACARRK